MPYKTQYERTMNSNVVVKEVKSIKRIKIFLQLPAKWCSVHMRMCVDDLPHPINLSPQVLYRRRRRRIVMCGPVGFISNSYLLQT